MRDGWWEAHGDGMTTTDTTDFESIKARQQGTWSSGDYAVIGTTLQITGEQLCEAVDVSAGQRVLDVAAGNGNASLAAARRGCVVTATDYVGALLEGTAARAAAEGLTIQCREADAEALPCADGEWDVVLSTFGVMFTPNQERAAGGAPAGVPHRRPHRPHELDAHRVHRPDVQDRRRARAASRRHPVAPPVGHGGPARASCSRAATSSPTTRQFVFRYRSAQDWLDTFRTYYGPTLKAFGSLEGEAAAAFEAELLALAAQHNTATDGTLRIPSDYLEVVVTTA